MIPKFVHLPTIGDASKINQAGNSEKYILLRKDHLDVQEQFAINRYEEKIKEETKFHYHDFVEITYIARGSGHHVVNDKEYKVTKGDLFIINYDMWHGFYKERKSDSLVVYNLLFTPDFLDDELVDMIDYGSFPKRFLLKGMDENDGSRADLHVDVDQQVKFEGIISNVYMEYTLKSSGYLNMIRAYMIELIINIVRQISREEEKKTHTESNNTILDEALKYLHENYIGNISLDALARKAFFSKNYFCRVFKQYTGMNVYELVHKLRIENACEMLKNTDKRILDIAMEAGYSDYKSFSANFKKIMGIKPQEFRCMEKEKGALTE